MEASTSTNEHYPSLESVSVCELAPLLCKSVLDCKLLAYESAETLSGENVSDNPEIEARMGKIALT